MQTEVLIVGGGLSGLALADRLARDGIEFILVEAQDRLGGRILTEEIKGGAFDLGPAWFWPGQPRMAEMASRFNLPVFEQYAAGDLMYQDQSGQVQRGRGYASMQGSYRLEGGMGALIGALAQSLSPLKDRIFRGARLTDVYHNGGLPSARVFQNDKEINVQAKQIVLALPPRVIAETIAFHPQLEPSQIKAMSSVPTWMAGQAKILAVYDVPHWRNAGLSGDAMSRKGPMVEIHDASPAKGGPYALFGFVGVPARVRAAYREALLEEALNQFVALFGPDMAHPEALLLQDWATLPEIARDLDKTPAAYHPAYGLPDPLRLLGQKGIHFGSTETARGFGGFLEGALEAAEARAQDLREALKAAA